MGSNLDDASSYLKASDFDLDDEALIERDWEFMSRTHLSCSSCEEHIHFDEEVIAIVVVQGQNVSFLDAETGRTRSGIEYYAVLDDDEEDFEYEPLLLHFDCWEEICGEYHELIADEPKVRSRTPTTDICKCSFCHTGVGPFQEFARVVLGEVTISERRQQTSFKETEGGSPEPVCLDCMVRINEQCIELWKS